jgi:hypothetical protein
MKRMRLIGTFILIFFAKYLTAEIQQIQVHWNTFKCSNACVLQIESHLKSIKDVTNVVLNIGPGTALMGWKTNRYFSYEPFKLASSAAGISFDETRLRVSGTISHLGENFYLTSSGDKTIFLLIVASQIDRRYDKISTYPLETNMKNQLMIAEKNRWSVVISGPLYLPDHYPLTLIAEQIQIHK